MNKFFRNSFAMTLVLPPPCPIVNELKNGRQQLRIHDNLRIHGGSKTKILVPLKEIPMLICFRQFTNYFNLKKCLHDLENRNAYRNQRPNVKTQK